MARLQQPIHLVFTKSAGHTLEDAVKQSPEDPKLLVNLLTTVDARDAHAIDIKYHKNCWNKYVIDVLCCIYFQVLFTPYPQMSARLAKRALATRS